MRRLVVLALATSAALATAALETGCGTILGHSGIQDVNVHLNPDDSSAQIRINGIPQGSGSGTYKVDSRRESNTIDVTTQDGKIGKGTVTREVMPGVVVADAFMLLFPIYIDYANGGMYSMQKDILINLGRAGDTSTPTPDPGSKPSTSAPAGDAKPCPFCGEARPASAPTCPHCGQK